jgi:hypothetical protein
MITVAVGMLSIHKAEPNPQFISTNRQGDIDAAQPPVWNAKAHSLNQSGN